MTLILKQIFNLLKLLNSEEETYSIAWGLSLGIILGFSPALSLQFLAVLFVIFFLRVQMGAAFLSGFFFKFISYMIDPAADLIGQKVLENDTLRPLFSEMYNIPLLPLTRFNNSIVMGSMIISILLVIPAFFVFKFLILKYREKIVQKYKDTKLWKTFKATPLYNFYEKYNKLYG